MLPVERWPWAKLERRFLGAQVHNAACPDWQRVAFAAWLSMKVDGVARFGRGELASAAARLDTETGELLDVGNPHRAIKEAIGHGWLGAGSTPREVFVPEGVLKVGGYTPMIPRRVTSKS